MTLLYYTVVTTVLVIKFHGHFWWLLVTIYKIPKSWVFKGSAKTISKILFWNQIKNLGLKTVANHITYWDIWLYSALKFLTENHHLNYCNILLQFHCVQFIKILSENHNLMIYLFCTICEPKIVLPVLQIKTKTISRSQLVQNM